MNYSQFSTIYNKLKEISTQGIKDAEQINKKIEQELEQDIKNTPEFEAWKKSGFSLDHVFNIDERQHALLIRACQNSDVEMVRFLLDAGASVNVIAGEDNPFTIIIEKLYSKETPNNERAESILNLLLPKLTSHVQKGKESVNLTIKKAVERGNSKVFNDLKDAGANFNIEVAGFSLLKWAEMHKESTKAEDMDKIINHLTTPLKTAKNVEPSVSIDTSEKSDATFWSKHKGKIALSIVTLFAAGAVTAFMFDLPIVALVLVASAAVTLMAIGIDKTCEKSPNTEIDKPSATSDRIVNQAIS